MIPLSGKGRYMKDGKDPYGLRSCPGCDKMIAKSRATCPYCKVAVYKRLVEQEKKK